MFVNRRTFVTKPGRAQDAVELLKTGANHLDQVPPFRVYTSYFGTIGKVELELEFESLSAYEKFWNSFNEASGSQPVLEKWAEMIEPGGTNEVWTIEE